MIYNHKVLTEQEKTSVLALIKHYQDYDKLDIIIELAVDDPTAILNRIIKKKKKETKTQSAPAEILYCDSDHCEFNGYQSTQT